MNRDEDIEDRCVDMVGKKGWDELGECGRLTYTTMCEIDS